MQAIGGGVAQRAETVQDAAYATTGQEDARGIIVVSGYVNRVVDEFCATGFRLKPPRLLPKDPHPPQPFDVELSTADLVTIGLSPDRHARLAGEGPLREALDAGAAKFMSEAAARAAHRSRP